MNPVPKKIVVNTGDQHTVQPIIDDFFSETCATIEARLGKKESPSPFEVKSMQIMNDRGVVNDDRLTYLLYNDRVVSGVFERRTTWNHVEYTFFRELRSVDDYFNF